MAENEANAANYTELRAHINVARKQLENEPPDTAVYAESTNDLSMYYERLVQLKGMRIETLEEQQKEATQSVEQAHLAATRLRQTISSMVVAGCFAAIVAFALSFPAIWWGAVEAGSDFVSIERIVFATVAVYAIRR